MSTLASSAAQEKRTTRVIAGLKASLHNPNVSEAAKASAVQRLQELESSTQEGNITSRAQEEQTGDTQYNLRERGMTDEGALRESPTTMHRKIGGYKATLKNPRVSATAKKQAQEALEQSTETM